MQGRDAAVEVQGLIAAPDACDDLGAQLVPGDGLLTLRVVVRGSRSHPGGCGGPGRFALFQWRAEIKPVESGQHRVRVLYDYRGLRSHPTGETPGSRDPYRTVSWRIERSKWIRWSALNGTGALRITRKLAQIEDNHFVRS